MTPTAITAIPLSDFFIISNDPGLTTRSDDDADTGAACKLR